MRKKLVSLVFIAMTTSTAQAASGEYNKPGLFESTKVAINDNLRVSGFGSVVAGKSNIEAAYMGYSEDEWEIDEDTLLGIQLEATITDKLKFVTQVVSKGRYDYDVVAEMAYISYRADSFTVRAGKFATPFFMFSDYLDVGYAYPMLRPSNELYDNIIVSSYEGMELLIPIELENSSIILQPYAGVSKLDERDAKGVGETTFEDFFGATVHWYVNDLTLRASYAKGVSEYSEYKAAEWALDDKKGEFISVGAHYDNGDLLAMIEAAEIKLDGYFSDTISVSGLVGYRIHTVMPYASMSWLKTTDNDLRVSGNPLNYKTNSYSVGARWDIFRNVALKVDFAYGVFDDEPLYYGGAEDAFVYSTAIDFVF